MFYALADEHVLPLVRRSQGAPSSRNNLSALRARSVERQTLSNFVYELERAAASRAPATAPHRSSKVASKPVTPTRNREQLWGGRRGNGNFVAAWNRWSAAMPQPNDPGLRRGRL